VSERSLRRASVVDELADVLREEILEAAIPAGAPLREVELSERFGVSRHTLRAALRDLASEGVVQIEPHRGARVAGLDPSQLCALLELRTALELEAARLALSRRDGVLPGPVHTALGVLVAATRRSRPSWAAIAAAHADLHGAIVRASRSPRIEAEYERLAVELRLFLLQLRPVWSLERMREHHEKLVAGLEQRGAEVLRHHLEEGAAAVLSSSSAGAGG
jgi:DNA-binding GntR family transcriptional regulator